MAGKTAFLARFVSSYLVNEPGSLEDSWSITHGVDSHAILEVLVILAQSMLRRVVGVLPQDWLLLFPLV